MFVSNKTCVRDITSNGILSLLLKLKLISNYICVPNRIIYLKHYSFIFALALITLNSIASFGQEPAHFVIGERELANTDVYSICQTDDGLLFVATNHGLFEYRHGLFKPIQSADNQHGNSLFNIKLDNEGNLFCGNLSGQILKLVNGKLQVFYELDKKDISNQLMYEFDDNNHLLLIGRSTCFDIYKGNAVIAYENSGGIRSMTKLYDGSILLGLLKPDSIVSISNGEVKILDVAKFHNKQSYSPYHNHYFKVGGKLFNAYANGSIALLDDDDFINRVEPNRNERIYQFDEKEVWGLDHANGARKITLKKGKTLVNSQTYFDNEFLSAIAKGKNNTLFFGTFKKGVIVVPNQATLKHNVSFEGGGMNSIAVDEANNVFISTRDGQVIHYNESAVSIDKTNAKAIDKIFHASGVDFGVNKAYPSLLYNGTKMHNGSFNIGSVKDVWQVDAFTTLIATSSGIYKTSGSGNSCSILNKATWKAVENNQLQRLSSIQERCKSVTFDRQNALMYVATHYALLEIDNQGNINEVKLNGERIIVMDLLFYQNKLWCSSLNYGILVFEKGVLLKTIDQTNGLGNNAVNKIEIEDGKLFISHQSGFQILELETEKWISLGTAEGILNGSVNDFALSPDKLWMISNGQPLSLDLDNLPQAGPKLTVHIDSLVVSGQTFEENKFQAFTHDQNQFTFYVDFRGIEYEAEARILYRIKGFEEEWNSVPSTTEIIEYKYLPPGDYTFEIKIQYRNRFSATKQHKFQINAPFWTTMWFYLLVAITIAAILIIIYLHQVKKIAKRNKERFEKQKIQTDLLESELKALRSEMNPHFIFNSLNSIQDLILQQDTDASYDYIVLFAELVRNTLNYSNKDYIPIEKELDFLEVYLSLEKLRFEEDFNYDISFTGDQEIKVPSLIVQPFIENALVHGLLHKDGKKNLKIAFEYTDKLICTITDNGVGRVRAKEIQERRGNHHESFALDAIKKRLSILSEQHGEDVGYSVFDLYDKKETATGTKVVITMPFKDQF